MSIQGKTMSWLLVHPVPTTTETNLCSLHVPNMIVYKWVALFIETNVLHYYGPLPISLLKIKSVWLLTHLMEDLWEFVWLFKCFAKVFFVSIVQKWFCLQPKWWLNLNSKSCNCSVNSTYFTTTGNFIATAVQVSIGLTCANLTKVFWQIVFLFFQNTLNLTGCYSTLLVNISNVR